MLSKYGNCTCLLKIKIQAENQLFLQIQLRRILDILSAFLIKQLLFHLRLLDMRLLVKSNEWSIINAAFWLVELLLGYTL